MIKFHRYPRINYWSLSPLANWLREKAGLTNPYALSGEGWDAHHKECKEKAPVTYWLTKGPFNKAQDICYFPLDVYWTIRVFYKNWKNNSHVLDGGLPVGQWGDLCYRIPRCLFGELEKFIEVEKGGLASLAWEKELVVNEDWGVQPDDPMYGQLTNQALAAIEQEALYLWWKANKDRDFYEESGYTAACEERRKGKEGSLDEVYSLIGNQTQEVKEALDKLRVLKEQYAKEEEEMLIRLIKCRESLWT